MAKTVKGARLRHRRTNELGAVPTIPPNDDHTSISPMWAPTDIYIGELFINTNETAPSIWFRDSTGVTQMATLDKTTNKLPLSQLTNNSVSIYHAFTATSSVTYTIAAETQYIVVSGICSSGDATINLRLDSLESGVTVVYISVNIDLNGGTSITVDIKNSSDVVIISITTSIALKMEGICLMWNGFMWVIISDTEN